MGAGAGDRDRDGLRRRRRVLRAPLPRDRARPLGPVARRHREPVRGLSPGGRRARDSAAGRQRSTRCSAPSPGSSSARSEAPRARGVSRECSAPAASSSSCTISTARARCIGARGGATAGSSRSSCIDSDGHCGWQSSQENLRRSSRPRVPRPRASRPGEALASRRPPSTRSSTGAAACDGWLRSACASAAGRRGSRLQRGNRLFDAAWRHRSLPESWAGPRSPCARSAAGDMPWNRSPRGEPADHVGVLISEAPPSMSALVRRRAARVVRRRGERLARPARGTVPGRVPRQRSAIFRSRARGASRRPSWAGSPSATSCACCAVSRPGRARSSIPPPSRPSTAARRARASGSCTGR